jgi:hypothetical protein
MSHSRSDSFTMKAGTDDKKENQCRRDRTRTDLRLSAGWKGCSTFVGRQRTTGCAGKCCAGERRSASGRAAAVGGGGSAAAEMPMAIFRRGTRRCSGDWTDGFDKLGRDLACDLDGNDGRLAARNLTRQWRGCRSRQRCDNAAWGVRGKKKQPVRCRVGGVGSSWGNGFRS